MNRGVLVGAVCGPPVVGSASFVTTATGTAFGTQAAANDGVAVGYKTSNTSTGSVAIGASASTSAASATAIGASCTSASSSVAVGSATTCAGTSSVSIGASTTCAGSTSVSIGQGTTCAGTNSMSMGQGTTCAGNTSVSIGQGTTCAGANSISMGQGTTCTGATSVAVGAGSGSTGGNSVTVGYAAFSGPTSIAIGRSALSGVAGGADIVAVGYQAGSATNSTTTGTRQTLVGTQTGLGSATQRDDICAFGYQALCDGNNAVAIGSGVHAYAAGAVAIGKDSANTSASTSTADEIKLGTALHTVYCGKDVRTSDPNAGAGKWKLGQKKTATVAFDTTGYVEVNIDGTTYKLGLAS